MRWKTSGCALPLVLSSLSEPVPIMKIEESWDYPTIGSFTECVKNFESPKCAEVCPVDACVPDPKHQENKKQLLEKWRRPYPGETSAS